MCLENFLTSSVSANYCFWQPFCMKIAHFNPPSRVGWYDPNMRLLYWSSLVHVNISWYLLLNCYVGSLSAWRSTRFHPAYLSLPNLCLLYCRVLPRTRGSDCWKCFRELECDISYMVLIIRRAHAQKHLRPHPPPGAQQYASWLTWFLFKPSYENQFISSPRHVPAQSISWLAAGLVLNCVLFAWLSVHQEPFLHIPPTCVPLAPEQPGARHDSSWLGGDLVLNCPSLCGMCLKICTSLSNICLFHRRGLLHLRGFNRNRIIPLQSHGCDKRALDYSSSTRPHTAWSFLRMANTTATRPHQCEECGMGGTCEVSIVGFIFRGLLQICDGLSHLAWRFAPIDG